MIKKIKNLDIIITQCILLLLIYSLILIYSASNKNIYIIYKRIFHITIGFLLLIYFSNKNIYFLKKNAKIFYIISNVLLILILIFGRIIKGARRWINLGIIQFQPSEISKITVPLMVTSIISNEYPLNNINILKSIIVTIIPSILIYLQPDLGTSILISLYGLINLYLGGIKNKYILYFLIILIISIPISWKFLLYEYQKKRIISLFNKNKNILKDGYHIHQSKIAIGSGGLFGKGILSGTQTKFNFIPENKTDFIFTIIAEEYGFIGIIILLLLYTIIFIKTLIIIYNTKDIFSKLLISNLIINFIIHIFINIYMVNGLLPIVGIPLPFISYGGTTLIITMIIFGIIISIKKNNKNEY